MVLEVLQRSLHHRSPLNLTPVPDEKHPELKAKVKNVLKRATDLRDTNEKDANKAKISLVERSFSHFIPVGTYVAGVITQIGVIIDDSSNSTAGQKVIEYGNLGGDLVTGGLTTIIYCYNFMKKDIEELLKGHIKTITNSQDTLRFLLSSHEFAELCFANDNLHTLRDKYETYKTRMIHSLKQGTVPTGLCAEWIRLGRLLKNIDGETSFDQIRDKLYESFISHIDHYKKVHQERLRPFQKVSTPKNLEIDPSDGHTSPIPSEMTQGDLERIGRELLNLLADSDTMLTDQTDRLKAEKGSVLKQIYTQCAPVGTCIATITGKVGQIIDGWDDQSVGTKILEFGTLGGTAATAGLAFLLFLRYKRQQKLEKCKKAVAEHADVVEKSAIFLEEVRKFARACSKDTISTDQIKEKYNRLIDTMLTGLGAGHVHTELCAEIIQLEELIEKLGNQSINFIDYENEDIQKFRKDIKKVIKENIYPIINHFVSYYDKALPPLLEEQSGWRTWPIFGWCCGPRSKTSSPPSKVEENIVIEKTS